MVPQPLRQLIQLALALFALVSLGSSAWAQEPNDQKAGSILFYNKYVSDLQGSNTQVNITNTRQNRGIDVKLFLVDGSTCSVADSWIYLTPNQTGTFFTSDFDPGVQGYIVAVAAEGGLPTQFNHLIGDAYIREADGHQANLAAVAVAKHSPDVVMPDGDGTADLVFDGADYDRLPREVAVSSFNSQVTDRTHLAIYSPSPNLVTGSRKSVSIFTLVYNDVETALSTSFSVRCYTQCPLTSLRVLYGLNNFVPAGRTGWIRMSASKPLLGATLNLGPFFNGGHNLHHLSLLSSFTITVPVF